MKRDQLDRWKEYGDRVEDFVELISALESQGFLEWSSLVKPRSVICKHYGIDLAELDRQRRALLDQQRRLNEG